MLELQVNRVWQEQYRTLSLWLARQYDDFKRETFNTRAGYAKNTQKGASPPASADDRDHHRRA
jgi:hypothetical protein